MSNQTERHRPMRIRHARRVDVAFMGLVASVVLLAQAAVATSASAAATEFDPEQAVWDDFRDWAKTYDMTEGIVSQFVVGEEASAVLGAYGDALAMIQIQHTLAESGDLEAVQQFVNEKLAGRVLKEISPGLASWVGWIRKIKAGMELFGDYVFIPAVESDQLYAYGRRREEGDPPSVAWAYIRSFGLALAEAEKALCPEAYDAECRAKVEPYVIARLEERYVTQRIQQEAAAAEVRREELRQSLLDEMRKCQVVAIEVTQTVSRIWPGEQVYFDAYAVCHESAAQSRVEVTRDVTWSGATTDNFYVGRDEDAGKTVEVTATYGAGGPSATARVRVVGDLEDLFDEIIGGSEPADAQRSDDLRELARRIENAVALFDRSRNDFERRLETVLADLASHEAHHACQDRTLGYIYAELVRAYVEVQSLGTELREDYLAAPAGHSERSAWLATGLSVLDQVEASRLSRLAQRVEDEHDEVQAERQRLLPDCDEEDLIRSGNQVAETGQDPTGIVVAGTPPVGGPDDGGVGGGAPSDRVFLKVGDPVRVDRIQPVPCPSGSNAILQTVQIHFTDRVGFYELETTQLTAFVNIRPGLAGSVVHCDFFYDFGQGVVHETRQKPASGSIGVTAVAFGLRVDVNEIDYGAPHGSITAEVRVVSNCSGASASASSRMVAVTQLYR